MRILNRVALAAAAFAPVVMIGAPANAASAGAVAFEGVVTLATFPCPPGCSATFNADLAAGAGISSGPAVAVVTTLSANVTYTEPPCVAGEAVSGTARGTATLGGTNVVGTLLPVTVPFNWLRVGLVAVVSPEPAVSTTPAVVGAAVFIPTGGAPVCTGGELSATIVGAAALVDTR